jgi:hypothetical protein
MRSIHIYCDGGFGNRFNGLISGLAIAELAKMQPIVVWPANNWCGARYDEILMNPHKVLDRELATYVPEKDGFHFFMPEDHLAMGVDFKCPLRTASKEDALNYFSTSTKDVFYHSPLIPSFLDAAITEPYIRALKFMPHIVEEADSFIRANHLDFFFGVQIRKTDFGVNGSDEQGLFDLITNCTDKRFFVCSDDKTVEARFMALSNVVIYRKKAHVEKLTEGDWNTLTADHSGRVYPCNINRSAQSVIDAITDLLILSRSQIVKTSNSTFLNTALLLKAFNKAA